MERTRGSSLGVATLLAWSAATAFGDPDLTVYNQDFAVVRDSVALDLVRGINQVRFTDISAHAESDSVILRDPAGKRLFRIVEQNYLADPLSQPLLLSQSEGKMLDFLIERYGQPPEIVQGKLIRSAYVMHQSGIRRYGRDYYQGQSAFAQPGGYPDQPIVEVGGKLRFGLPGTPLFPALADDAALKPTIHWVLDSDTPGKLDAELTYITGGMSWEADYNLASPRDSDDIDLVGWVTMDNQSGKTFENARIKLMAGDVNKLRAENEERRRQSGFDGGAGGSAPPVTEQTFDDYHLYILQRPATLLDRETKQVEFLRADGVKSKRLYIYDGVKIDRNRYGNESSDSIRTEYDYGVQCNHKVWIMREFANSSSNHLGVPLPRGRVRFYRRSDDGHLEFTGENWIDHTPRDESVRVSTGNAFDLVGERVRTDFKIDEHRSWIEESFKITVGNHKIVPAEIRVVEHLYRWMNWEVTQKSHESQKTDSQTIEFRVTVPPDKAETVTYTVHYSW
jgi:hypothetical protein